jgi:hypothetical protein
MVANKSDITSIKLTIYMGTIKAQKKAQTCASKGLPGNHPAKVRASLTITALREYDLSE